MECNDQNAHMGVIRNRPKMSKLEIKPASVQHSSHFTLMTSLTFTRTL